MSKDIVPPQYEHLPHTIHNGFAIYYHENKMNHLKSKDFWTVSQIQRRFKIGYK